MIGVILIAASWGLLRLEKKPLSELGFDQAWLRTREFAAGLLVAGAFAAVQYLLVARAAAFGWVVNPDLTGTLVLDSLRWNTNSVLFEELTFRGYLLYQAIRWLGPRRACLLSAAAFGVYHWFSFGVLGHPQAMAYVFVMTGTFGLMLAVAFAKTGSLALPIGLHLAWNLITIFVFSNGPIGAQLLVPDPARTAGLSGVEALMINAVWPMTLPILVLWGLGRIERHPALKEPAD